MKLWIIVFIIWPCVYCTYVVYLLLLLQSWIWIWLLVLWRVIHLGWSQFISLHYFCTSVRGGAGRTKKSLVVLCSRDGDQEIVKRSWRHVWHREDKAGTHLSFLLKPMADVLQPAAWNCNLSKYESLEQLYQVLADAQGCQHFASILADLQTPDIWEELLPTGRAEDAGSIAQHAIIVSLSGEISPESEKALAGFFETVVKISHDHPLTAALVLGGTLSALRSNQSAKKSLSIATRMLQIWFTDTAFEAVIHALIKGIFKDEVAEACGGWLCSVPDRMAQAFGTFNSTCGTVAHFLDWMRSSYSQRLVTALVASLCENPDWDDLAPTSLDLLARVVLRGHRAILAAHLCSKALSGKATVVGQIILKLSEEHVSAGRSLACAILEASTAVLQTTSTGLVSYDESGNLLAVLRPALKRGLPIQQLLAVHIWQIPLGSQLSPAVVFALVDELMESECSSDVCTYWFNAWADPRHRDLPAEQNLALRVARTLRWQSLVSPNLHLLLQGVQHRLSAQAKTSRLYGMAVAETLASSWMDGKSEGEEKLQFDDFDRYLAWTREQNDNLLCLDSYDFVCNFQLAADWNFISLTGMMLQHLRCIWGIWSCACVVSSCFYLR